MMMELDDSDRLIVDNYWHEGGLDMDVVLARRPNASHDHATVGLYLICAEWNIHRLTKNNRNVRVLFQDLMMPHLLGKEISPKKSTKFECGILHLSQEDLCRLCGDDHDDAADATSYEILPCPPKYLPVFLLVLRLKSMSKPHVKFLIGLNADTILKVLRGGLVDQSVVTDTAKKELTDELRSFGLTHGIQPLPSLSEQDAVRIFVSGDRMSVGKTSVCLGLLGSLVQAGHSPDKLAYIKPATQNEKPQLVQWYCEKMGIPCIAVGPIVYYSGFTRAYLAGDTESSQELLSKVSQAVDELAVGKSVVVIDGVGFPAVGSICGTDNASVALASSYPNIISSNDTSSKRRPLGVLLVGGPGVGSAVDAFNLNATYFERAGVPILGAIFNKLSLEGFYSLDNCKKQISLYFSQNEHQLRNGRVAFGFCPEFPKLGGEDAMDYVFEYIRVFSNHVNMDDLIESAVRVKNSSPLITLPVVSLDSHPKRQKVTGDIPMRKREEIENAAIHAGAAPSA